MRVSVVTIHVAYDTYNSDTGQWEDIIVRNELKKPIPSTVMVHTTVIGEMNRKSRPTAPEVKTRSAY